MGMFVADTAGEHFVSEHFSVVKTHVTAVFLAVHQAAGAVKAHQIHLFIFFLEIVQNVVQSAPCIVHIQNGFIPLLDEVEKRLHQRNFGHMSGRQGSNGIGTGLCLLYTSENLASIVGLGVAMEEAHDGLEEKAEKLTALRDKLIDNLLKIPHTRLNGGREHRLCTNVNISFEGIEGEGLLLLLDLNGIAGSSGSACTSGSLDPVSYTHLDVYKRQVY